MNKECKEDAFTMSRFHRLLAPRRFLFDDLLGITAIFAATYGLLLIGG